MKTILRLLVPAMLLPVVLFAKDPDLGMCAKLNTTERGRWYDIELVTSFDAVAQEIEFRIYSDYQSKDRWLDKITDKWGAHVRLGNSTAKKVNGKNEWRISSNVWLDHPERVHYVAAFRKKDGEWSQYGVSGADAGNGAYTLQIGPKPPFMTATLLFGNARYDR